MKLKCALSWLVLSVLASTHVWPANKQDMDSFQKVWETIRDRHWDLAATGVDWDAVYKKYKPKAQAAKGRNAMRGVLQDMIGELGQSHFNILGEDPFKELDALNEKFNLGSAGPGFSLGVIGDRVFIVRIDDDSDAKKQGLGIGTEILYLEDEAMMGILAKLRHAYRESPHRNFYIARSLNEFLNGLPGMKKSLKIRLDGSEQKVSVKIMPPKGKMVRMLELVSEYRFDKKMLRHDIGYVAFNVFVINAKPDFDNALREMAETRGLIIDLRGNPGGLGILSSSLSNRLISEKNKNLGEMIHKGTSVNFAIFPQKPIYEKPVAILIDSGSASTSEMMAAGLKDLGRAKLFGTRSAGAALPSFIEILPNGDRFQYAVANYRSVGGDYLEGKGVAPDAATPHSLQSMQAKKDAALEAAITWINQQSGTQGD